MVISKLALAFYELYIKASSSYCLLWMTSSSSRKDKRGEMVTQYFHKKNLLKILFLKMSDLVNFFRITVLLNLPKTLSILRVQSKSFSLWKEPFCRLFVIYSSLRSFDTFWHFHIFILGGTLHKRSERHIFSSS